MRARRGFALRFNQIRIELKANKLLDLIISMRLAYN